MDNNANHIHKFEAGSVELDIADEGNLEAWVKTFGAIHVELVDPHGPGGGWPVYRFVGPIKAIRALVNDYEGGEF